MDGHRPKKGTRKPDQFRVLKVVVDVDDDDDDRWSSFGLFRDHEGGGGGGNFLSHRGLDHRDTFLKGIFFNDATSTFLVIGERVSLLLSFFVCFSFRLSPSCLFSSLEWFGSGLVEKASKEGSNKIEERNLKRMMHKGIQVAKDKLSCIAGISSKLTSSIQRRNETAYQTGMDLASNGEGNPGSSLKLTYVGKRTTRRLFLCEMQGGFNPPFPLLHSRRTPMFFPTLEKLFQKARGVGDSSKLGKGRTHKTPHVCIYAMDTEIRRVWRQGTT